MKHPLSRLIARYGRERGTYLFGEYAAMSSLGFVAYARRHSPLMLASLEAQLAPLNLWPEHPWSLETPDEEIPAETGIWDTPPLPTLDGLAHLVEKPLLWAAGSDLFDQEARWAEQAQAPTGAWFEASRLKLSEQAGFLLPSLATRLDGNLATHAYQIRIWGRTVAEGVAYPGLDCILADLDGPRPPVPLGWQMQPTGLGWSAWMPVGPHSVPPEGLERLHWLAWVERHVSHVVRNSLDALLTEEALVPLLLEASRAGYQRELERYVSVPELLRVFRTLLRQGLPLRPLPQMLEALQQAVLSGLAARTMLPPDMERLGRRLPFFSTQQLVRIVRVALALPPDGEIE
ncbi:MAG: FHIPEP family type III secretion protein [Candidatus Sericytochromatia bacterium]|nr:FHIPEP family type III secretion protein [Candidatus Sericytochromatia bacterium]